MAICISPLDSWIARKAGCHGKLARERLEDYQLERLRETLDRVCSKSRFYQKRLREAPAHLSDLSDLAQFPFTTSQDIRDHGLQFLCVSQDEIERVVTLDTSGTTGQPKRLFFTAGDQELTIDFFGVGMSILTEAGDRVLILLPCETTGSVGDLLRQGLARLDRIPLPYGPVRDPLHALQTMQTQPVDCLVGSPTQVLGLARRWSAAGKAPRSVLLSTDYVPAAIVRTLEDTWGCKVFNHYGTTETGLGGGVECQAHRGYHLREADLLFEVIDPQTGGVVQDGEYGEVVFTTLTRQGMPLIRYRTGDRSRFIPAPCPCGASLRTLEKVSGRFGGFIPLGDEMLTLADLDEALFPIPGLLNFSATVTTDRERTSLLVETRLLTASDSTTAIARALSMLPALKDLDVVIHCRQDLQETGSLLKRTIIDKRISSR